MFLASHSINGDLMKKIFLVLSIFLAFGFSANADTSRSFSFNVEGEKNSSLAKAKLSYFSACAHARSSLQESKLAPYLKSVVCGSPAIQEGPSLFKARGGVFVELKRKMKIEQASLSTDFASDEREAKELWNKLCEEWNLQSTEKTVYQSCGNPKIDSFYTKPEIHSSALRVEKVRVREDRGQYCHCRDRRVETETKNPWGRPILTYRRVFDLMLLVEEGFYEKQETFSSVEECQDRMVKSPLCSEE